MPRGGTYPTVEEHRRAAGVLLLAHPNINIRVPTSSPTYPIPILLTLPRTCDNLDENLIPLVLDSPSPTFKAQ